ncbi:hypothetical protein [Mesorhizobium sp. M0968]|uniref:hypothetical protein n=1 Tax=Mesorhizobium sp. M0968 TaxID=2957037 RepID=UPI0033359358
MTTDDSSAEFSESQTGCTVENAGTVAARAALAAFADRLDLAREFLDAPFGRHSADLCFVLDVMRSHPTAGKWFTIMTKPYSEWRAARWSPDGQDIAETAPVCFQTREDVERWVFKQRWRHLIGAFPLKESDDEG